jgi:ferritin-like metal-binding protein YciE
VLEFSILSRGRHVSNSPQIGRLCERSFPPAQRSSAIAYSLRDSDARFFLRERIMRKETVERESEARRDRREPTEGGKSSKKTMALRGSITKGSAGRPKASPQDAPVGETHENKTTSTSVPRGSVPKRLLDKLSEMHRAETELTLALPLVAKAAKSKDLKRLLNIHHKETKGHVKTLDEVAKSLGVKLPSKSCKKMTQLIGHGVKVIAKRLVSGDKDPELIAVGQRIEQFEIDSYTPLCKEAEEREYTHEFALLTSILNQEKLAHQLLGELAAGKGPLQDVVEEASLKKAGAGRAKAV